MWQLNVQKTLVNKNGSCDISVAIGSWISAIMPITGGSAEIIESVEDLLDMSGIYQVLYDDKPNICGKIQCI